MSQLKKDEVRYKPKSKSEKDSMHELWNISLDGALGLFLPVISLIV